MNFKSSPQVQVANIVLHYFEERHKTSYLNKLYRVINSLHNTMEMAERLGYNIEPAVWRTLMDHDYVGIPEFLEGVETAQEIEQWKSFKTWDRFIEYCRKYCRKK